MRSRHVRAYSASRFEQRQRQADQVVEIDRIERGQARLVARIQVRRFALARAARGGQRLLGREAGVLRLRQQVAQREQLRRA